MIHEIIRKERKRVRGLSQAKMAEELGVARTTYQRWEKHTYHMPLGMLIQICERLKLKVIIINKDQI